MINIDFDNNTEEEVIYTETVEKKEYAYDEKSDILVYENEVTAIKVLNETNKYRSGKPLVLDTNLSKIASIRALELANSKELTHIRPNGRYYSELFEEYNINATFSGENIAQGYTTPKEVCEVVPLDRLLLETDCPYLSPHPLRGTINEPKNLGLILDEVARLKNLSKKHIADITFKNTCKLFHV